MRRYIEIIRRRTREFFIKAAVVASCSLIMLCVFYAINNIMRYTTIEINGDVSAEIWAPIEAQAHTLNLANISTIPQDKVEKVIDDGLNATIEIERAFEVEIIADGESKAVLTTQKSIQTLLQEQGYNIGEDDYTVPEQETTVTMNTEKIELNRVEYVQYEVDEVIPYETEMQYTSLFYLFRNTVQVMQEGQDGYFKGIMEDKIVNGEVEQTTQISVIESVEPVSEILKTYKEGVPISDVPAPDGITVENLVPSSYSTVYEMKATGYYSATGKGASGLGLYYGTFAVDPTLIPYGTKVYIVSTNGKFVYGWAIATDTGAFINTTRMQVDLFYESYAESAANGVQQVLVYIP